jgi:hypothetical protein
MKFLKGFLLFICALAAVMQSVRALPAPRFATSALVYNSRTGSSSVSIRFSSYSSCLGEFSSSSNSSSVSCPPVDYMKMSASVPSRVSATFGAVSKRGSSASSVWPISYITVNGRTIPIYEISGSFPGVVSPLGVGIGAPVSGQRVIKVINGVYFSVPS